MRVLIFRVSDKQKITNSVGYPGAGHIGDDIRKIVIATGDIIFLYQLHTIAKEIRDDKKNEECPQQSVEIRGAFGHMKTPEEYESAEEAHVDQLVEIRYPEAGFVGEHLTREAHEDGNDEGPDDRDIQRGEIFFQKRDHIWKKKSMSTLDPKCRQFSTNMDLVGSLSLTLQRFSKGLHLLERWGGAAAFLFNGDGEGLGLLGVLHFQDNVIVCGIEYAEILWFIVDESP